MVLSGPLWELGRGGSGQFSIFADGIEDASGIDRSVLSLNEVMVLWSPTIT